MLPIWVQNLVNELNVKFFSESSWFENARLNFKLFFFNRNNSPTTKIVNHNHNQVNLTFTGSVDQDTIAAVTAELRDLRVSTPQVAPPNTYLLTTGQSNDALDHDSEFKSGINKRIDEAVTLLNLGRIGDARNTFVSLLGEARGHTGMEKELGRLYNNIGVTYKLAGTKEDYDTAIQNFRLAIELDPLMWKAKMNLAHSLISKGGSENIAKGYQEAQALWSVEKNPDTLVTLLLGIRESKSVDDVLSFLNSDEANDELVSGLLKRDNVRFFIAGCYLSQNNYKDALLNVEEAMALSPDEPEYACLKARALMVRAQNEHRAESDFDIVPRLNDYQDIQDALSLFETVTLEAQKDGKKILLNEARHGMAVCQLWLNRFSDSLKNLKLLTLENPSDETLHQLDVLNLDIAIKNKDFETAYNTLTQGIGYARISYSEKRRLARVFVVNGAVEQAKSLLNDIQEDAERFEDVYFWFDLSAVCVLLNQKNEAITAAARARKVADKSNDAERMKQALSHYNAIMFHYAKPDDGEDSETSRLVVGMQEFQNKYPEEKLLTSIQAIDEQGELTDEIKNVFGAVRERFNKIKEIYQAQPITIYHLEKFFNRELIDIATRGEVDFPLFFTDVNGDFLREIQNGLDANDGIIFDYLFLLDVAKMGLLGLLEKTKKRLFIHQLLFRKIQEELLTKEVPELRSLWEFLRKSKAVHIIREEEVFKFNNDDTDKLFEPWIVQTLGHAKTQTLVLATDDVRLLAFARSEKIAVTNVLAFLKYWVDRNLIDGKMNSRAIGDLAERFYTFLSFTGEDLFEIVIEDKAKITPRSYHLVREIFLPGSEPASFIGPYIRFLDLLWKTGVLPLEKAQWLGFISSVICEVIDGEFIQLKTKDSPERSEVEAILKRLQPLTTGLAIIWKNATKNGNRDDLEEALKILNQIFNKDYLSKSKKAVLEQLEIRIKQLSSKG